jgi:hypothetical protein
LIILLDQGLWKIPPLLPRTSMKPLAISTAKTPPSRSSFPGPGLCGCET